MPNKNKARGKYFESKIVDAYRDTLNLNKLECYRSGSSGARTSLEITGDVSFNDPSTYSIITECKYRLDLTLDDLFPVLHSEVDQFIEQNSKQEILYIKSIQNDEIFKTNEMVSVIVIGRPHQKVENYYTLIMQIGSLKFTDKPCVNTYSQYLSQQVQIVPFSVYLEELKRVFRTKK